MIIKLLAAILAVLMLTVPLAGCGGKGDIAETASATTTAPVETEPTVTEMTDNLPEADYDGREFRMISYETVNCNGIHVVAEQTGEIVSDTMYEINRRIEYRFNIVLKEILNADLCLTNMRNSILAGDDACEVNLPNDLSTFAFVQNSLVHNYSDLSYIDLGKPYWDASLNEKISINGQHYYALGGFDLSHFDYTHVLVFSKKLIENFGLEEPYDIVEEGGWTIDVITDYMKAVVNNPDFKVAEDGDIYGYDATAKQVLPNFWMSCGEFSIRKDADDRPYFAVTGNEKFTAVFNKCFEVLWDDGLWFYTTVGNNTVPELPNHLESDQVLFGDSTFHYVKTLRGVDADFGLLPYPKWDEAQEAYYSRVEGGTRFPLVPVTVIDTDYVSMIIEAVACENMKYLLPAYYEIGLKGKIARDTSSESMLNIIYDTRTYDMGDTIWCNDIRDGKFADMFKTNNRNLTSVAASIDTVMIAKLEQAAEVY
ncbi:MAG: hypothetical protein GX628_08585 [Clostridiales bacterium]|nr:hypothetical protein [Clostridiales bacterium]